MWFFVWNLCVCSLSFFSPQLWYLALASSDLNGESIHSAKLVLFLFKGFPGSLFLVKTCYINYTRIPGRNGSRASFPRNRTVPK